MRHHNPPMKAYVYILASRRNGTLYVGVTRDLRRRLAEHQRGDVQGFTARYGVNRLVWFEEHDLVMSAVQREKNIKHYSRRWKINLVQALNPDWQDLTSWLIDAGSPGQARR